MMTADREVDHWLEFVAEIRRRPEIPFDEQWTRFGEIFAGRHESLPPPPVWVPDDEHIARSNLAAVMRELGFETYRDLHHWSTGQRDVFWQRTVERLGIVFARQADVALDLSDGPAQPKWFRGAELNIADSCFQPSDCTIAIALGREGSNTVETVTYGELEGLVNRIANGLVEHGFSTGDAVALYMPMNVECVAAYLGIVRAGCAVVSIADSFAPPEVRRRLEIANAVGIITVDTFTRGGRAIALYDKICEADGPRAIIISKDDNRAPTLRDDDLKWEQFLSDSTLFNAVTAEPHSTTNILFSSGTTGNPKAIPWTHLTPIKCAMDGHFHQDIRPGDVVAWPTNIGWMMGPWLIYATLINRACIALYEGLPSGRGFTDFVRRTGVSMLGVVPSLVRAWRDSGACDATDWSMIRTFSSTGEPSNRRDYLWLMSRSGYRAPVIEYCGGTEIGGGHLTGTVVQPASPAAFSTPALGLDLVILDDDDRPVAENIEGEVFLVPPSIGLSQELLNRDHDSVYYADCPVGPNGEVLRRHGDQVARLPGGYFRAQGRADDTMNLGGVKVSSLELERVLDRHPKIFESAAIAAQPEGEGAERLVIFAVLVDEAGCGELRRELGRMIATELNPLFKIHDLVVVDSLPRTASNKLMRRELRARYLDG